MNELLTKEQMDAASRFWAAAKEYVLAIAALHDIKVQIESDSEFLYSLYEDGHLPDGDTILKALRELEKEQSA